jgi:hypothetical protein
MGMPAAQQRIASAYAVFHGRYGDVRHYAQQRGACRQWVYRQAAWVQEVRTHQAAELERLRAQVRQLEQRPAEVEQRLARAAVIDPDKQAEVATAGQARGVTLRDCRELLEVLIPGQVLSVATLGRRTQAAGARAGPLLEVLDEAARQRVCEVAADEIYVKDPVLMLAEPESLCWPGGRLSAEVSGAAGERELAALPQLEQVLRDGGTGLEKGVALVNAQRPARGPEGVVDQGDHFHAWRGGSVGLRQAEMQARQTLAAAEAAPKAWAACARQGRAQTGPAVRAGFAWERAAKALDDWQAQQQAWHQTKEALPLFTPTGELNTRARAEAVLAEALPPLPASAFAKTKRQLQKPEMLNYLGRVGRKVAALPLPREVKAAAVWQEGLRCRPEARQGASPQAAVLRGILLLGAVVLSTADEGGRAVTAMRDLCRRAYRASSLVEGINSVLRMHQAGHRQLTQGLLDLQRLYWKATPSAVGAAARPRPTSAWACRGRRAYVGGICSNGHLNNYGTNCPRQE